MMVNEIAKKSGLAPHVVRYYVRIGLLKPSRNPNNGYQLFCRNDIQHLEFIRRAQYLGFTLSEIDELLTMHRLSDPACCHTMYTILKQRINENKQLLEDKQALQQRMEELFTIRDSTIKDCATFSECPLITTKKEINSP